MTGNQCLTCGAGAVIAWCFAVVVILVGLVAAYYLLNAPRSHVEFAFECSSARLFCTDILLPYKL